MNSNNYPLRQTTLAKLYIECNLKNIQNRKLWSTVSHTKMSQRVILLALAVVTIYFIFPTETQRTVTSTRTVTQTSTRTTTLTSTSTKTSTQISTKTTTQISTKTTTQTSTKTSTQISTKATTQTSTTTSTRSITQTSISSKTVTSTVTQRMTIRSTATSRITVRVTSTVRRCPRENNLEYLEDNEFRSFFLAPSKSEWALVQPTIFSHPLSYRQDDNFETSKEDEDPLSYERPQRDFLEPSSEFETPDDYYNFYQNMDNF
ncbi:A-agglutinin anchorage subunit-like [Folsomia candida]|uniref:A-agglutinin anchorage subunit-like n=1 Tax=Folsomia candida TaxID=158441 RepID=UPI001604DD40|nr:A-agglutinin anchorage subunit-like [Folsomia candida]